MAGGIAYNQGDNIHFKCILILPKIDISVKMVYNVYVKCKILLKILSFIGSVTAPVFFYLGVKVRVLGLKSA